MLQADDKLREFCKLTSQRMFGNFVIWVVFFNKNTQINKFPNFVEMFTNFVIYLSISGITVVFLTFVTHHIRTDQLSPEIKTEL